MCRIYGFLGKETISKEVLDRVAQQQIDGGPDAQYLKYENDWAIGNNRLAIQGLQGGKQPFSLGNIHLVYNGEIYNHEELKAILKTHGYSFSDSCDGHVILPLYELYGLDFVKYLDGMFAIAIIDNRIETKLIIASDPASIKSLYYYWDDNTDNFYFSSELAGLFEFPINKDIRLEAIDEYLIGRSIWSNNTFFKNIFSLGPAELIIKNRNSIPQKSLYKSNITAKFNELLDFNKNAELFHNLFEAEIKQITATEVPICVVTSGGLDSSYVTAISKKFIPDLHCFNIAYDGDWPSDERNFAKEVSNYYGAKYHQILLKEQDFPEILKKTISHLGQPNSAPHSLSTYALFEAIKNCGFKVAITGEGADEYFAGYDRFKNAAFDCSENRMSKYFDIMCATTTLMRNSVYSNEYQNYLKENNNKILINAENKIHNYEKIMGSKLKALLKFDQEERFPSYILKRVDHLSMANSIEVRVPFCQPRIISFAASLPDNFLIDQTSVKKILYQAARNYLPKSIIDRPKQPFTLPIVAMLKKGHVLFEIMNETLNSYSFKSRGIFDYQKISLLIDRQLKNPSGEIANLLWSVMVLELWLQNVNNKLSI